MFIMVDYVRKMTSNEKIQMFIMVDYVRKMTSNEKIQMFIMVDYVRKMTSKKSCRSSKYGLLSSLSSSPLS